MVIVFVNGLPDCAVILSPVVLGLFAATHVKVEDRLAVNGMLAVPPLQIVPLFALVILGGEFTTTEMDAVSAHKVPGLIINVTVYVPILA